MTNVKRVLILGYLDRQAIRESVRGITQYAHVYGPWVFYHRIPFYKSMEPYSQFLLSDQTSRSLLRRFLESGQVDGLIAEMPSEEIAAEILPEGFPAVLFPVQEIIPGFVNVISSGLRIGEMAVNYLEGLGFKNIAFFGLPSVYWSRCRETAFRSALDARGIEPFFFHQKTPVGQIPWGEELEEIANTLKEMPRPLAVWSWNDDLAETIIEACRLLDILVPDEVCVLGTDNDELLCNLCDPPLSSIAVNFERTGYEIAEILDLLMAGKSGAAAAIEIHPLGVIERLSTEIQAVNDIEVSRAVRFIRQNAHQPIQVSDVVSYLSISRSLLYERFREAIGRTIHEEIKRVRVETIAKALVTTTAPIKQIAFQLGFPSEDHLSRYFRGVKNCSPQMYRKKFGKK